MPASGIDGGGCYFIDTKGKEKGMKKRYEKPQVYMERFEMSVSVAACDVVTTPDGQLKTDTTKDKIGELVKSQGGFAKKEVCDLTLEDFGYYGGTLIFGSY